MSLSQSPQLLSGKLPAHLLDRLLTELPLEDLQLLIGPSVGEDAAVIDWNLDADSLLVAKSDPITFATDSIGFYAVTVCANDLAVTGAVPRYYLPTILLPAGQADVALAERIFTQIGETCRQIGVVVAGGHSEITPAVNQPVLAGTMLGIAERGAIISTGSARRGDLILMAGVVPIEGVSIIARQMRQTLVERGWSASALEQAANYLYQPGISVLPQALLAAQTGVVTSMHDPTEGGIATGLMEVATAARVGLEVDFDRIQVPELAGRLCAEFGLDPLGTIASGALLATTAPPNAQKILDLWQTHGWPASIIGRIIAQDSGLRGRRHGLDCSFPEFAADEITKLWR